MDIFRTFDALNDYRNFETVVPKIKEYGKHFQGCICYTLTEPRLGGEVYNLDYYVNKAKDLEAMGADSICIKDMAGLIAPYDAYAMVKALKAAVKLPVHLHSHFTSGMSPLSHLKAIEAGVDIIDTCMTPFLKRGERGGVQVDHRHAQIVARITRGSSSKEKLRPRARPASCSPADAETIPRAPTRSDPCSSAVADVEPTKVAAEATEAEPQSKN